MELRAKDARVTSAASKPTRDCANMGLFPPPPSGGNFRGGDYPSTIPNRVQVVAGPRRSFVAPDAGKVQGSPKSERFHSFPVAGAFPPAAASTDRSGRNVL